MMKFFTAILLLLLIISLPGTARGWSEENSTSLDKYSDRLDQEIEKYDQAIRRENGAKLKKFGTTIEELENNPEKVEKIMNCMHSLELTGTNDVLGHCLEEIFGQNT
jgi:peptidoglycan hydrolase CwlO-like protein